MNRNELEKIPFLISFFNSLGPKLLVFWLFFGTIYSEEKETFFEATMSLKEATYWTYPYPNLIEELKKQNKKSILIFSYGSLMDPLSAARTFSKKSQKSFRPGCAFGIRRLFDLDVPIVSNSKWGIPQDPLARGMLNVMVSERKDDLVNGVLIDVLLEDIPNVMAREQGYDLLPVVVQDWDCKIKHCYQIAYTFYSPQGKGLTKPNLLPRPGYYELTRNASLLYGQTFYRVWLKSTFLADGITPIIEWEKKVELMDASTRSAFPF